MRLTLRTMLAYLDDVLEADDAAEIGKKIEESTFASDLTHRIRGSVRRLQLPTPPIDGEGIGLDANSVSEYLDSTLSDDQVPEFEKVCLDSDVHLAEVASCHQILTLVLGDPANVDQATRERIYEIGKSMVMETSSSEKEQPDSVPSVLVDQLDRPNEARTEDVNEARSGLNQSVRSKSEIPDYLRDPPRRRLWPVIVTAVVAAMITFITLILYGPIDRTHPAYVALFGVGSRVDDANTWKGPDKADSESSIDISNDRLVISPAVDGRESGEPPSANVAATTGFDERNVVNASSTTGNRANGLTSRYSDTKPTVDVGATLVDESSQGENLPAEDEDVVDEIPTSEVVAIGVEESEETTGLNLVGGESDVSEEQQPTEPVNVGRYPGEQVLARLNVEADFWQRLAPNSTLFTGDSLLALPNFQPQINLDSGMQLTLVGGTLVRVEGSPAGEPRLHIRYGRCLMTQNIGNDAPTIFELAGRRMEIKFANVASEVAIEVQPIITPGMDIRKTPAINLVRIVPYMGTIEITIDAEPSQIVTAGEAFQLVDGVDEKVLAIEELPTWIHGGDLRAIDRTAADELERALPLERSIELTLAEKTEASSSRRREEVRALAAHCLTYFNQFNPVITSLNDSGQRPWWHSHFLTLRTAVARSSESADALLDCLEKQQRGDAEELLQLIYGYSPNALSTGKAADLVDFLEHSKLIFRVLARENLQSITGLPDPYYRPEHPAAKRKRYVKNWRKRLEAGEIVYDELPLEIRVENNSTPDSG